MENALTSSRRSADVRPTFGGGRTLVSHPLTDCEAQTPTSSHDRSTFATERLTPAQVDFAKRNADHLAAYDRTIDDLRAEFAANPPRDVRIDPKGDVARSGPAVLFGSGSVFYKMTMNSADHFALAMRPTHRNSLSPRELRANHAPRFGTLYVDARNDERRAFASIGGRIEEYPPAVVRKTQAFHRDLGQALGAALAPEDRARLRLPAPR